jgi:DNA-directed RNA polymerase subunit M/transcription elongation factor TFIIS
MPKEEADGVFLECKNCGFRKPFDGWTEHDCSVCSHKKAIVILHEMVRGDEGTTTMYRCLNCGTVDKEGWIGR